jgi:probable F420-dependent oxidoreductase
MSGTKPGLCVSLFGAESLLEGRLPDLVRLAVAADEAGVDQVNVTDHVVMGGRPDRYPYGRFPFEQHHPWPEPLTLLAAFASVTRRVRLATGVLIAPLRPAPLLAKQAATLDALSEGRLDLGVGVGWQREEYDACGVDFDLRWRLLDETLRTARELWRGSPVHAARGAAVLEGVVSSPAPVQNRLPVWFGVAATPRQARRIAEIGDGWVPIDRDPDHVAAGAELIRDAFRAAGRATSELTVRAKLPRVTVDTRGTSPEDRAVAALAGAPATLRAGVNVLDVALAEHVDRWDDVPPFLAALVVERDRLTVD